jgi:hypothetical protein
MTTVLPLQGALSAIVWLNRVFAALEGLLKQKKPMTLLCNSTKRLFAQIRFYASSRSRESQRLAGHFGEFESVLAFAFAVITLLSVSDRL